MNSKKKDAITILNMCKTYHEYTFDFMSCYIYIYIYKNATCFVGTHSVAEGWQ